MVLKLNNFKVFYQLLMVSFGKCSHTVKNYTIFYQTLCLLIRFPIALRSMLGRITIQTFNFDESFQAYRSNDFAWDFFQDPCLKNNLKVLDTSGSWTLDITRVNVEVVPCTKVSVDLFDPIYSNGILRPSGHIVKCNHEIYPDFDELRTLLLEENSDSYHIISLSDRQEFLFRLFKHMVLGGELCQYEDAIDPYIETLFINLYLYIFLYDIFLLSFYISYMPINLYTIKELIT
uniref:Cilia- and flagella-associated protein 300 n=1 Tax=Cyprinus carpio TaxID=7962 RepID=A0A8C2Q5N2_CYPCA